MSLLIPKIKFLWGGPARFWGGTSGKIGTKLKNAQFPMALKGNFYCVSLNGKNTPVLPFCPQIPSLTLELSQKIEKKAMFFNKF